MRIKFGFILALFSVLLLASAATAAPVWVDYPNGIQLTSGASYATDLNNKWTAYKAKFIGVHNTSGGQRSIAPEHSPANRTVSEGQAYAMIFAVYMGDKTVFDALLKYKIWLCQQDSNSQLMPWATTGDGSFSGGGDSNSATDADTDMAWALMKAAERWGGSPSGITGALTYNQYAQGMLNAIASLDIAGDGSLKPGDSFDDYEFPSYYSEAYYREFGTVYASTKWASLITMCNNHLVGNRNATTGLTSRYANNSNGSPYNNYNCDNAYRYDACRTPMRYAIDYVWNGDAVAGAQILLQANFFDGIAPGSIMDGYNLDGSSCGSVAANATFVGPAGCSFMRQASFQSYLDSFYATTSSRVQQHTTDNQYYNASVGFYSMLVMSGHYPKNFTSTGTPTNTPTGGVPSGCLVDDLEDGDNVNNFGGFWYTYSAGTGATIWPNTTAPNLFTMTAGGSTTSPVYAARITGTVGPQGTDYPSIGMGVQLNPNAGAPPEGTGQVTNISTCTGVRFNVKGDGKQYHIKIPYTNTADASLTGYNDYRYDFTAPAAWTQVDVAFTLFAQATGWGTTVPLATVLQNAKAIQFQTSFYATTGTTTASLYVDDLTIYGCTAACPTPPATATITPGGPTLTFTPVPPTATYTHTVPAGSTNTYTPTRTNTPGVAGECILDNCEDMDNTNLFGGYWYTYAAGTGATIVPATTAQGGTFVMATGGSSLSPLGAARITGTVGPQGTDYPSIGMGCQLNPLAGAPPDGTGQVTDISGCTGVRFYTKGDAKQYHIKIPYTNTADASLTGYNDYRYDFTAPAAWTQVDIPFALFAQATGWGTTYPLATVLTNAKSFQFQTSFYATTGTTTANLYIDDVTLYGCTAACPVPPTSTPTIVLTSTFTHTVPAGSTSTFTRTNTPVPPTNTPTNTPPVGSTATFTPTNLPAGVCLIDNCEDGDNTNLAGGYWYTYAAGNGVSIVPNTTAQGGTFTMTAGGNGGSAFATNFTGTVGTQAPDYPSIGVGCQLNPLAGAPPDGTGQVTDISGCTGVRFYTKGDGKQYHIKIPYSDAADASLTGYNDYRYDFTAGASWTQVDIPFALFAQATGWGTAFPLATVLTNAKSFQFQTSFYATAGTTTADLWVDDLEIYGCTAACPVPPTSTPTTVVNTPTNTNTIPAGSTSTFTSTNTPIPPTATFTNTPPVGSTATFTPTNLPAGVCLIDNCEDGDNTNLAGGYWYTYAAGNGVSIVPNTTAQGGTFTMTAGGNGGSAFATNFTGTVGTQAPDYPSIGVGCQLNPMAGAPPDGTGQVTDISGCTGVRFYTKGDGKQYHIKIPYSNTADASLTGYNDYRYDFTAGASWTQVDIPFALFAQATGWGTAFPLATVLTNAKSFQFQTSFYATAGTTTANLWIDDLQIYGCTAACPAPPTSTPTTGTGATATYTNTVPVATSTFTVPAGTATFTNTVPAGATSTNTSTNTTVPTATFTTVPTLDVNTVGVVPGTGVITIPSAPTVTVSFNVAGQSATNVTIRIVDGTLATVATIYSDATTRAPGSYSVNIDLSGLTTVPDGSYSVAVVVANTGLGQTDTAYSGTRSWDFAGTVPTFTITNTPTSTLSFTPTNTFTYTSTNTPTGPTATYTPTDAAGVISVSDVTLTESTAINTLDLLAPGVDGMDVRFVIGTETGDRVTIQIVPKNGAFPVVNLPVADTYTPGVYTITVPEIMFANVPTGLYDIVVKAENTSSGNYDVAVLPSQQIINSMAIPTYTPTVVPTQGTELKIPEDSILPYPNPANGGDVNIKFALTKNAKTITFKLYTSASRLVRQVELPVDKINMGIKTLTAGDNIVTIPAESFKDTANGTYYYVVIVKDDKGNTAKSKVDKIIIIKGKTAK